MNIRITWHWYALVGLSIFCIDRITKWLALATCMNGCRVLPFLSFEVALNRGVTWGMFSSAQGIMLYFVMAMVVGLTIGILLYAVTRYKKGSAIWAEFVVLGASCSNIFDRCVYGGVVDFILLSYKQWSWPVFNVADVCIVCGVAWMMMDAYLSENDS